MQTLKDSKHLALVKNKELLYLQSMADSGEYVDNFNYSLSVSLRLG